MIEDDDMAGAAGKYAKLVQTLEKMYAAKQRDWHTHTTVYYGPPGTGKTRRAKYEAEAKYGADNVFWLPPPENGRLWWDGYNGEPAVIIDEYYGSFMPQTLLQRVCDRYPLRVPTKGSTVPLLAKEIWMTSNFEPVSWYKKGLGPLARRLTGDLGKMIEMTEEWIPPQPTNYKVIDLTCQETLDDTLSDRVKTLKREREEINDFDPDERVCPECGLDKGRYGLYMYTYNPPYAKCMDCIGKTECTGCSKDDHRWADCPENIDSPNWNGEYSGGCIEGSQYEKMIQENKRRRLQEIGRQDAMTRSQDDEDEDIEDK